MSETAVTIFVILLPTFAMGAWLIFRGICRSRAGQLRPGFGGYPAGSFGRTGAAQSDMFLTLPGLDDAALRKSESRASRHVDFDTSETKNHVSSDLGTSYGSSSYSDGGSSYSGGSDGGGGGE